MKRFKSWFGHQRSESSGTRGCFLFQRSAEALTGKRRIRFRVWNWGVTVLMGLLLGVLSLMLAYGPREIGVFAGYFRSPMILLLNLLPPLLLMLLGFAITGRRWAAWLIASVLVLGASLADFYMLCFRDDPFTASELLLIREGMTIASNYKLEFGARVVTAVLAIPAGAVLLGLTARERCGWKLRVALLAAVLVLIWPLSKMYTSRTIYNERTDNYEYLSEKRAVDQFIGKGFWYPFLHSVGELYAEENAGDDVELNDSGAITIQSEPQSSGAEPLPQVTYTSADIDEDRKVDVVMVMLEAFSDLSRLNISGVSKEVYADWHALEEESYHGNLRTNIFAAGTVNTERCVLTGDLWVPKKGYSADAGSYVRYLADQGYNVTGSHQIYGWFYDRREINAFLGFRSYEFWEERYESMFNDVAECLYHDDIFLKDVFEMYLNGTGRQLVEVEEIEEVPEEVWVAVTTTVGTDEDPEDPGEQPTEDPAEQPSEGPTEQPSEDPAEQPPETPTEQPTEDPTEQPSEDPAEQPSEDPAEQPSEDPAEQPTEDPAEQPTEDPAEQPSEDPAEQPPENPAEQPPEIPAEQPPEIPAEQPPEPPVEQPPVAASTLAVSSAPVRLTTLSAASGSALRPMRLSNSSSVSKTAAPAAETSAMANKKVEYVRQTVMREEKKTVERIEPLENAGERTPYFGFHVTYQGHATYPSTGLAWGEGYYVRRRGVSDETFYILNNYLGSVMNTIRQIRMLQQLLAEQEEPVVLVLFGDHMPWLGDGNSVYEELGVDLDAGGYDGFCNYYTTPYLIWANDAAKEALGSDFVGEGPDISPAYLMNQLFELCGWDGPAYMQMMDDLQTSLPVVNTAGYYMERGVFTDTLSDELERALTNVRKVSAYRRTHPEDVKIVTEEFP